MASVAVNYKYLFTLGGTTYYYVTVVAFDDNCKPVPNANITITETSVDSEGQVVLDNYTRVVSSDSNGVWQSLWPADNQYFINTITFSYGGATSGQIVSFNSSF